MEVFMTKTNLLRAFAGIVISLTLIFSGAPSAQAKSINEIATVVQIVPPMHDSLILDRPKWRDPNNRWQDSGVYKVWDGVPKWIRDLGLCIRKHESIEQGHYRAHNGGSSASGAYQFLDGTWQGIAKWVKVDGEFVARKYSAANHAPAWVQDAVFIHSIRDGGIHNWNGTHCGYGT